MKPNVKKSQDADQLLNGFDSYTSMVTSERDSKLAEVAAKKAEVEVIIKQVQDEEAKQGQLIYITNQYKPLQKRLAECDFMTAKIHKEHQVDNRLLNIARTLDVAPEYAKYKQPADKLYNALVAAFEAYTEMKEAGKGCYTIDGFVGSKYMFNIGSSISNAAQNCALLHNGIVFDVPGLKVELKDRMAVLKKEKEDKANFIDKVSGALKQ